MMKHRIKRKKDNGKRQLGWTGRTGLILLALLILLQPMLSYSGFAADTAESAAESQLEPEGDLSADEESIPEETEDSTAEAADADASEREVLPSAEPTPEPEQDAETEPETPEVSSEPAEPSDMEDDLYVTVQIHDMAPDGTELLNDSESCFTIELAAGADLQQAFDQQETVIGSGDTQTLASKLVYYQRDEAGQKYRYSDLSQPVSEDLELYTYQYRLCAYGTDIPGTVTPEDDAEGSAQEENSARIPLLELTVREGQPISAEQLTVDGTELTSLSWTDETNGEAVDLAALMVSGLTANLNIQAAEQENNVEAIDDTAGVESGVIICYAAVDGAWVQVGEITTTNRPEWGWWMNAVQKYRFTVSAEQLYGIYKDYGLTEADIADLTESRIFPHTDSNDTGHIWADTLPIQHDGKWWIPVSARDTSYLYYIPQNTPDSTYYFTDSCDTANSDIISENSAYHLDVIDPKNLLGDDAELPEEQLILPGKSGKVTLPVNENIIWRVRNRDTGAILTEGKDYTATEENGQITFYFSAMTCPVRIMAIPQSESQLVVKYEADVTPSLVRVGSFDASGQAVIQNGMVYMQTTYLDENVELDGTYRVLAPDYDYAELYLQQSESKKRHVFYTFQGWKVKGTDVILSPGLYAGDQIASYMTGDVLELQAVWTATDAKVGRIETANFYINLNCEIMDNNGSGYSGNATEKAFGQAVYSTRVFGTENVPATADRNNIQIIAPPEEATAYAVDAELRESVTTPITDEAETYAIQLDSFPSDEYVFRELRAAGEKITLDGTVIPTEYLNTDNFQIRWYVLKYHYTDGWHIDGVLVAKKAELVIKKTFAGDQEAINEIVDSGEFYLAVNHLDENKHEVEDYHLTLQPVDDEESSATNVGYTEYDETTHTYTWVLDARQGRTYTVQEYGYVLSDEWNHTNRYRIRNASDATGAGEAWQNYDYQSEVKIVAEAYPADLPEAAYQTVEFENLYVKAGLLTVHKIDSVTENGLKNVSFKLSLANGGDLQLYQKPGTSYYSTDNNANKDGYTTPVPDNIITTDSNGYFYVKLAIFGAGETSEEYILEETVPTGYEGPTKISVTVSDDGTIKTAYAVLGATTDSGLQWISGENTSTLTVMNRSKLLTEVKAQKIWEGTPEADQLPVKVELRCNGIRLRGNYIKTLSKDNNWTYVWENLPLFVDGKMAQYTIFETAIGDEDYDPEEPDGYSDYLVEYDAAKYKEGTEGDYTSTEGYWEDDNGGMHYADHALLVARNQQTKGKIAFQKVGDAGQGVSGALFGLYQDRACTNRLETAESDTAGFVSFKERTRGTYYLQEITPPVGYELDDMVYTVVVKGGTATITDSDGEAVTKIVNHTAVPLTIQKTDTSGKSLSGAVFTLYRQAEDGSETVYGICTTGHDGTAVTKKLEQGVYRIEETQAPSGFRQRTDSFTIKVENGEISSAASDTEDWQFAGDTEGGFLLTVINHALYQLPNAGGRGIGWPTAIGCMLMCAAAAGYLMWLRRQRRGHGM